MKPTEKMSAAGLAGAVSVLVVFVAGAAGLDVPPGVAAALTSVLAFAAGYVKREGDAS